MPANQIETNQIGIKSRMETRESILSLSIINRYHSPIISSHLLISLRLYFPASNKHTSRQRKRSRTNERTKAKTAGCHPVIRCLFTCCTYHWVELWLFRWPPGLQGAQSSRGVSLFTPLAEETAPVATGVGDAVGLSPSSPPNTGHSIHVF